MDKNRIRKLILLHHSRQKTSDEAFANYLGISPKEYKMIKKGAVDCAMRDFHWNRIENMLDTLDFKDRVSKITNNNNML